MSDVSCPRCGDSFRLPDTAIPPGASARCPWCGDTLPIAQLLANLPPVAEVFMAGAEPLSGGAAAAPWDDAAGLQRDDDAGLLDDAELLDGTDLQDEYDRPAGGVGGFAEFAPDDNWDQHEASAVDAPPLEYDTPAEPRPLSEVADVSFDPDHQRLNTRGRAKKKTSSIRSILGIVFGGLLAIPLAAIILAILGQPLDLGFWPFDGQTIATGTSARTAAPPVASEGSQANEQQPMTPPQGRSFGRDQSRESAASGVVQADHDSPHLQGSGSLVSPDRGEADDAVLADAGQRTWTPSPRHTPGARTSGPEWVEPLAVDDDAEPAKPLLSPDTPPEPNPLEPVELQPGEPLELAALAAEQQADDPALERSVVDEPTSEVELSQPDTLLTDMPELPLPDLDVFLADSQLAVPQPDDPPSIDAADVSELDVSSDTTTEMSAVPETASTGPQAETALAEPEAETVAEVETSPAVAEAISATDEEIADEVVPDDGAEASLTRPSVSSPLLQSALDSADAALGAVQSYDHAAGTAGLKPLLAALYADVAAVGELAQQQDEAVIHGLVDRLNTDGLIKDLAPAAPNWLKYSKRPNSGMLAVGVLRQQQDKWFVDWSGAVPLEVRPVDTALPAAGTQVLVLGRIVNADPSAPAVEPVYLGPLAR